ncbi:SixA phosphatase family protein [Roseobacteraceae bacterium S113]
MKRLILMRHCKSSWSHPDMKDHNRPLNGRGYRSAKALGDWLRKNAYVPELALISTARRTMETFEGLGLICESRYRAALYHAEADRILGEVAQARAETVLLIGHNPGIAEFAERIVVDAPAHARFFGYPTGATTVIDFDGAPRWGKGNARDFVVPRDLLSDTAG